MNGRLFVSAITILVSASAFGVELAENTWPQWRGPDRTGEIGGGPWPGDLSETSLTQQWSVKLGKSYSGPIVDRDRVYLTESVGTNETAIALDRKTGQRVWRAEWPGSMSVPFFAMSNGSWIRSTPALADGRLYVAGMRDVLVCLNAETGDEVWRVDFPKEHGSALPTFGFVASPLVHNGFVYVQAGACFAKLNAATGEIAWQTLKDGGGMGGSAFSSPIIATIAGREQLVVQGRKRLSGVDIETGKELWGVDVPAFRGMNILTPTIIGDSVFTSSYGGGSFLFDISRNGDSWNASERWANKREGYMSSPIVKDGRIYLHMRNQRLTCIDVESGEELWATRPYGKYWSMVASGNKILALDQRGDLYLIAANPKEFQLLDSRHLSDASTWAHLAVTGDQLHIRSLSDHAVYQWKTQD